MSTGAGLRALWPAMAANFAAGSLYAMSVLLRALEEEGRLPRSLASSGFSLATAAFLVGVLSHPGLSRRIGLHAQFRLAGLIGAVAIACAAIFLSQPAVLAAAALGYGTMCGHLYCGALVAVKQANLKRLGLATGVVVASFAAGSVAWSLLLGHLVHRWGLQEALWAFAAVFSGVALSAARGLAARSPARIQVEENLPGRPATARDPIPSLPVLWVGFFAVAAAGLGVISQSALFSTTIPGLEPAWLTALVGLANGAGRLGGGGLADRLAPRYTLAAIAMATAVALVAGMRTQGWGFAAAVVLVALCYGAASSAYPAALMRASAGGSFSADFARLFTGWGLAALVAPATFAVAWHYQGDYVGSFAVVAGLNLLVCVVLLPKGWGRK